LRSLDNCNTYHLSSRQKVASPFSIHKFWVQLPSKEPLLDTRPRLVQNDLLIARLRSSLILLFLLSLTCVPVFGQRGAQTVSADLNQLVDAAAVIVRGHVVSAISEPHPQFSNLQTVLVTLSVAKVLKGEAPATYTFRQFVWDYRDVADKAGYSKSSEVLLFLNPVSPYGLTSPVGLEQGRFRVFRDAKGKAFVLNGRANVGLFDQVLEKASARGITLPAQSQEMITTPRRMASLDAFENTISAIAGASR
jgi:hypothetical protein